MNVDTVIRALRKAEYELPRESMRWTLDNWEEAAPELLRMVEQFTSGVERSEETASSVFFALHLAGEKRDARVFPLLCRLAQDSEAIDAALGDGTTTTFKRILISTYDGDLGALKELIEAPDADEFVRAGALEVLAYLTVAGRISGEAAQTYLLQLYDTLKPQHESFVWSGWAMAVYLLGLESLSDVVQQAFKRGLIDPMVMDYDHFREDLQRNLADPTPLVGFERDKTGPLDDAIGELSSWYAFSDAAKRDQDRRAIGIESLRLPLVDTPLPIVDPFKGIGRNDPCPCGSGKKFKKCCLQ